LIKEAERAGALPALSAPALLRKLMAAG